MEFNLGFANVLISDTQLLALFWVVSVAFAFNAGYWLFVRDRGRADVTRARITMTVLIGTLIVIGTYADVLCQKPFALKDCLLLALVAAHGWMAEDLVKSFMKKAAAQQPVLPQ
ncbi:MAG: hypothetical protein KDK04_06960 [Candidatus Competibacteraceae bacterium]|nr:hypothetical protein [Caldilineaceae bacterium]MCB1811447.1 hypothetical protein [Candidatus Competibacteraceae bacterium]